MTSLKSVLEETGKIRYVWYETSLLLSVTFLTAFTPSFTYATQKCIGVKSKKCTSRPDQLGCWSASPPEMGLDGQLFLLVLRSGSNLLLEANANLKRHESGKGMVLTISVLTLFGLTLLAFWNENRLVWSGSNLLAKTLRMQIWKEMVLSLSDFHYNSRAWSPPRVGIHERRPARNGQYWESWLLQLWSELKFASKKKRFLR